MKLLIDTAGHYLTLALMGEQNYFHFIPAFRHQAELLIPEILNFMDGKAEFKDLTAIAVGVGPGSFTGVRIAATVGQTLSFILKIPLIAFASHDLVRKSPEEVALIEIREGQFHYVYQDQDGKGTLAEIKKLFPTQILSFQPQAEALNSLQFRSMDTWAFGSRQL